MSLQKGLDSLQQIPRYTAKPLEGSASRHLGRILLRPSSEESEPLGDYTLIHRRKARLPAVDLPDYRTILHEKEESEDELEGVLGQVTTLQDSLKAKRVEFERHLSQHPDDVKEWIKYSTLHLQEQPSSVRKTGVDQASQPTTRANAEVTLWLLERALNAHRSNFYSTELHIAFLHAAESFWPADKVTQRWQNVISQLSSRAPEEEMIRLYLGYIDWREGQGLGSSGNDGGIDEVVNVYIEVLDRLRATSDGELLNCAHELTHSAHCGNSRGRHGLPLPPRVSLPEAGWLFGACVGRLPGAHGDHLLQTGPP